MDADPVMRQTMETVSLPVGENQAQPVPLAKPASNPVTMEAASLPVSEKMEAASLPVSEYPAQTVLSTKLDSDPMEAASLPVGEHPAQTVLSTTQPESNPVTMEAASLHTGENQIQPVPTTRPESIPVTTKAASSIGDDQAQPVTMEAASPIEENQAQPVLSTEFESSPVTIEATSPPTLLENQPEPVLSTKPDSRPVTTEAASPISEDQAQPVLFTEPESKPVPMEAASLISENQAQSVPFTQPDSRPVTAEAVSPPTVAETQAEPVLPTKPESRPVTMEVASPPTVPETQAEPVLPTKPESRPVTMEVATPPTSPESLAHSVPFTEPESGAVTTAQSPTEKEEPVLPGHESMVTVRLSEPLNLSVNTDLPMPPRRSLFGAEYAPTPTSAMSSQIRPDDIIEEEDEDERSGDEGGDFSSKMATGGPKNLLQELNELAEDEDSDEIKDEQDERRDSSGSETEEDDVNWDELQKKEDEQAQDRDDNSTAMLLARLEEENNKLATNPKGIKVQVVEQPTPRRPRPPSMAQLRNMVHGPTPVALRYSVLPPPPMTDLEFYMALVKDYQQTAARLPTLLSKKIRQGIPPPLRGVVWQSMAGARDSALLEQYERLGNESSPYEGLIGKDLGRSFPGVDMFRDPDGDGQRMLGRVLKCFSLYDQKIGYCQGLAFLVGPLLMHMPDNQAFCVLVRLMDQYDLRSCFLPDLSGLHVRIYQFRELLRQNLPTLSAHLDDLQVDPAYVSQWFLSFFAVTCPLPMLFRIYDVIFAEGASETIMRVAMSLMRKNASRILACSELEDVMQLLLSRGLWDCYHYNADEFVEDFVSLSNVVSREKLAQLEQDYREAQIATANAARTSDVTTAASRFLGRLWAATATSTNSSPKSALSLGALSPGLIASSRPMSMLRRSTSKQSLASTLNSMDASSSSVLSTASTDATTLSRDSSSNADDTSIRESAAPVATKQSAAAAESKALHSQIEDLLTALSELQRSHAVLATELQREREQREEERQAVKSLIDGLKKNGVGVEPATGEDDATTDLSKLIDGVQERITESDGSNNQTAGNETRQQLRDELARAKEHLLNEVAKSQELNRRIDEAAQEAQNLKDQLRESHTHARSLHQDKQRLEKQVHTMRMARSSTSEPQPGASAESGGWLASAASLAAGVTGANGPSKGGLRELKLGRSQSTPNPQASLSNRTSSLVRTQTEPVGQQPVSEHDALLLELVQAKTAEAVARQEADEYKQKLESFKRAHGIAAGETATSGPTAASAAATAAMGMFGRLTGAVADGGTGTSRAASTPPAPTSSAAQPAATAAMGMFGRLTGAVADGSSGTNRAASTPPAATSSAAQATTGGGFWGWRR